MSRAHSGKATSLDILEDALNSLYKARKSSLVQKQLKFERIQKKRMIANTKGLRPKTPNPNINYNDDLDEGDDDVFTDSLASSLTLDPVVREPKPRTEELQPSSGQKKAYNYDKVKDTPKLFKGSSESFTALSEMKEDQAAGRAFIDFRKELETWWERNGVKRHDSEARAQMADYLSEQYLSKRLDPLPSSRAVSQIRKNMSDIIEEMGSATDLENNWPAKVFNSVMPGDMGISMRGGPPEKAEDEPGTDVRGPAGHQRRIAMAREEEKMKMKREYEQYMKLKKDTEAHPDNAKVQEYEKLQDEIKSLMSSIATTPQLDD